MKYIDVCCIDRGGKNSDVIGDQMLARYVIYIYEYEIYKYIFYRWSRKKL